MAVTIIDKQSDIRVCDRCKREKATYWMERIYDKSIIIDRVCNSCALWWQDKVKS